MDSVISSLPNLTGLNGSGLNINSSTITNFQYSVFNCNPDSIFAYVIGGLVVVLILTSLLSERKINQLKKRVSEYEQDEKNKKWQL